MDIFLPKYLFFNKETILYLKSNEILRKGQGGLSNKKLVLVREVRG